MPRSKVKAQLKTEAARSKDRDSHDRMPNAVENILNNCASLSKLNNTQSGISTDQTEHVNEYLTSPKFSADKTLHKKLSSVKKTQTLEFRNPLVEVNSVNTANNSSSKTFARLLVNSSINKKPHKQCHVTNKNCGHKEKRIKGFSLVCFKDKFKQTCKINKTKVCGESNDAGLIFQFPSKHSKYNQENVSMASPKHNLSQGVESLILVNKVPLSPVLTKRKLPFESPTVKSKKNKNDVNLPKENHFQFLEQELVNIADKIPQEENYSNVCAEKTNCLQDLSPVLGNPQCTYALNSKPEVKNVPRSLETFSNKNNSSYSNINIDSSQVGHNKTICSTNVTLNEDPFDNAIKILSTSKGKNTNEDSNIKDNNIQEACSPVLDSSRYIKVNQSLTITQSYEQPSNAAKLSTSPVLDSSHYK